MSPYRGKGMILMRWVETPDGGRKQVDFRLTPELFLHQTYEDRICYCTRHNDAVLEIAGLLRHHFRSAPDVTVFRDMLHLLGPGLPTPGPDVSVVRGLRKQKTERFELDFERDGGRPCLIVEVVSPNDRLIRQADLKDKVEVYERAGVQEYVIADWSETSGFGSLAIASMPPAATSPSSRTPKGAFSPRPRGSGSRSPRMVNGSCSSNTRPVGGC